MPLNNFGIVVDGCLYRSAQPDADGIKVLKNLGINTIIRLSHSSEGNVSSDQETALFRPGVLVNDDFPEVFRIDSQSHAEKCTRSIFERVKAGEKVLVHCSHGRDRTGLICGAYKILICKSTYDQVMDDRKTFGANAMLDWSVDAPDLKILKSLATEA